MDKPSLLLTRPRSSAQAFAQSLDQQVMEDVLVCISPLLEITPLGTKVDLAGYTGVIFTSTNAVSFVQDGQGMPAFCVGARTAEAATGKGWRVERIAQDADALVASLSKDPVNGPLLHLAGKHRRGEVAERLSEIGITTNVADLYDQVLLPLSDEAQEILRGDRPVVVPLFSPRTAAQFAKEAGVTRNTQIIAISDAVAKAVQSIAVQEVHIATAPTAKEMRRGVEMLLHGDSLG